MPSFFLPAKNLKKYVDDLQLKKYLIKDAEKDHNEGYYGAGSWEVPDSSGLLLLVCTIYNILSIILADLSVKISPAAKNNPSIWPPFSSFPIQYVSLPYQTTKLRILADHPKRPPSGHCAMFARGSSPFLSCTYHIVCSTTRAKDGHLCVLCT